MGCVSFTSMKINLSASLGKRKKTKHSGVTNFDTQLHRSNELELNIRVKFRQLNSVNNNIDNNINHVV